MNVSLSLMLAFTHCTKTLEFVTNREMVCSKDARY